VRTGRPRCPAFTRAARPRQPSATSICLRLSVPMTDHSEITHALERLVTEGHQDSSLSSALQRIFPNITQQEIDAERRLKKKVRLGADPER